MSEFTSQKMINFTIGRKKSSLEICKYRRNYRLEFSNVLFPEIIGGGMGARRIFFSRGGHGEPRSEGPIEAEWSSGVLGEGLRTSFPPVRGSEGCKRPQRVQGEALAQTDFCIIFDLYDHWRSYDFCP